MSLNLESISIKMTDEMDKAISQKPVTGFLADNNLRSKFVGAKTVMIPEMNISGLGDYDRDNGFVSGTVSITAKPYTLTMDRGRSFQLDREDYDESGIGDLAGQIMGEFVRTKVVPEVDAYVLSKLAGYANGQNQVVSGDVATDSYQMLTTAIARVQDAVGYDEELVAFVDGRVLSGLQNSEEMSRHLVMNDFKKGEMYTKVNSLNGVSILPVPNSRMKTAYDFFDGATLGQQSGGFAPASTCKNIGLLVMPRRAAALIKKTEQVRCFDPAHNQKADAWKLDYRLYYDVVIRDALKLGIIAHIY